MKMKMRKLSVIILSLIMMLGLASCVGSNGGKTKEATASPETKANLDKIIQYIGDMEGYIEETQEILEYEISDVESDDDDDDDSVTEENEETLREIYGEICVMKEDIADIPKTKHSALQQTYDVANQYFTELEASYNDLLKLYDLSNEVTEISDKYLSEEVDKNQSVGSYISETIKQFQDLGEDLSEVDCPEYMQETFDKFVQQIDKYVILFENYYAGIESEDYLKVVASEYMQYYISDEFNTYSQALSDDLIMQFEKVQELLDGRIQTYQKELKNNCEQQKQKLVEPSYTYYNEEKEPSIKYTYEDTIYPATYNTLDSVIRLVGSCDQGECDVIIKVEMPEFAVTYEQKVTLYSQMTQLYIKPVIDSNAELNTQKTVQMKITVTDGDTGKVYVQDSKNVTIMSKNDLELFSVGGDDGSCYNVLAWMTPESDAIMNLKRVAIEWLTKASGGTITGLVGYQGATTLDDALTITSNQAIGLQNAMSSLGVRYNMDAYSSSTSDDTLQRVMYPSEVIGNASGICIETSLVMASALQSAGFNVMLIFPPGHCFVAVEIWPESGEYIVVETTCLPTSSYNMSDYVYYATPDEWSNYIDSKGCTVVDCSLARELGIVPYFD